MPSTLPAPIAATDFRLADLLRAGDTVVCGQTCAEPLTLTRKLMQEARAGALPELTVFIGAAFANSFEGSVPPGLRFLSYGSIGRTASLADAGVLDVLTERYSRFEGLFTQGNLAADVVLLQIAPGGPGQLPSMSLANDYTLAAARRARLVIAEVHGDLPWTFGTDWPSDVRIDYCIRADAPPLPLPVAAADSVSNAIAQHVASLVPHGATLQIGVGSMPDATLAGLLHHRDLGLHTGIMGDAALQLIEAGALTNARKGIDAGVSVTHSICGTDKLYRYVHNNPQVAVRPASYTHAPDVLAQLHQLHAINAALEIDLSGQVNSEQLNGKARGGIGGLLDFSRAARQCAGGRAITVLPATAAGGKASRIALQLQGPATLGRSDIDVVVTEYGIAHLRDVPLAERARRLVAIAAPQFRDDLLAQLQQKP